MISSESLHPYQEEHSRFQNFRNKTQEIAAVSGKRIGKAIAKVALPVAAWTTIIAPALDDGITFLPEKHQPLNFVLSEEDREQLSTSNPAKIVHRAGNSREGIRKAYEDGGNFAELDVTKVNGELYADHGQTFDNPIPLVNGVIKQIGFDASTLTVRTGDPNFTVEDAFIAAGEINKNVKKESDKMGLFPDLKRGDINEDDIVKLWLYSIKYDVPLMLHSGRDDFVFMARQVLGELERHSLRKTPVLNVLGDEDELERFVQSGGNAALIINQDIITNESLEEYGDAFNDMYAILYIKDPQPDSFVEGAKLSFLNGFMGESNFLDIFPE